MNFAAANCKNNEKMDETPEALPANKTRLLNNINIGTKCNSASLIFGSPQRIAEL